MKHELIVIVTTTEKKEDAEKIAEQLVKKRMCACAQVSGPINSWYWWEGKVESSEEWQVKLKTVAEKYGEVEEAIKAIHPYDLPQIVALPVANALKAYTDWVVDNLDTNAGDK